MANESNKGVLNEEKRFHERVIGAIGKTSYGFGKLVGKNVKSAPAAGAGLVSGAGRTARHPLFLIIISMIFYIVDAINFFYRPGLNPYIWFSSPMFWIYFIFVIIIAVLIFWLSWKLESKEISVFVLFYLFVWMFPIIKGYTGFIPAWIYVISCLFGPIYFMFVLPHERTTVETWIEVIFLLILIIIFGSSISEIAKKQVETGEGSSPTMITETGRVLREAINSIITSPRKIKEGFISLKESTQKAWQRQIAFATGDYYIGQVDQNAKEKLGVYIEDIKLSAPVVYEGEPISIWATLKARTLGDKIINVNVSCKTKDKEGSEIIGYTDIGKKETLREFKIAKMEEEDIDCNFKKYELDTGAYEIKFNALFNFETMAYLKTYFINKERQRSLIREGIDVFEQYGITDTAPTAIYTNGPIKIGMETTQQPIGLSANYDNKPRLGITFDNAWEGKIKKIRDLVVYIPEDIEIGACLDSFEPYDNIKEEEKQKGYDAYKLRDEIKEGRLFKDIEQFITINCRLNIPLNKVSQFLGKTPITTKYFKVTVDYEYELEKGISISIKEPKDFNVRIKETNPTSGEPLNCYGKYPDKKLTSAECDFYEVKDEREDLIKDKVTATCPDKACNCILNNDMHLTKRGQIIKCKMIATYKKDGEEEKESDSDSVKIINSPPVIEGEIEIEKAVVNEDLICKATIKDNDNDPVIATYEFSGDYAETGKASCSADICAAKIDGFKVIEGASITCKIVPNDGIDNGKEKTKTVTVKSS